MKYTDLTIEELKHKLFEVRFEMAKTKDTKKLYNLKRRVINIKRAISKKTKEKLMEESYEKYQRR